MTGGGISGAIAGALIATPLVRYIPDNRALYIMGDMWIGAVEGFTVGVIWGQVRPDAPNAPAEFWAQFASGVDTGGIVDELTPVYEKHFTPAELAEMVKFYESPVGQKLVRVQQQLKHARQLKLIQQLSGRQEDQR